MSSLKFISLSQSPCFYHVPVRVFLHFIVAQIPIDISIPSETDFTFPLESRRKAEDILVKNKARYHIQVFSGVSHGFALRADLTDENAST